MPPCPASVSSDGQLECRGRPCRAAATASDHADGEHAEAPGSAPRISWSVCDQRPADATASSEPTTRSSQNLRSADARFSSSAPRSRSHAAVAAEIAKWSLAIVRSCRPRDCARAGRPLSSVEALGRVPQRQCEGEAGALPRRAVDGDVAAHGAGEPAGDVEAEAGAARLGRVDPLELARRCGPGPPRRCPCPGRRRSTRRDRLPARCGPRPGRLRACSGSRW